MAKIVFLEADSVGKDMDLSIFEDLGDLVIYPASTEEEFRQRVADADIAVANKLIFNEENLKEAKNLRLVCLTATGTDNLDKDYLASRGIEWRNVAGYSTEPVAQHTFALFLYLCEKLSYYDHFVKSGEYSKNKGFTDFNRVIYEMYGKTWGIVGMGAIGRRVAELAKTFGCRVIYYSTSGANQNQPYPCVSLEELYEQADIISMHAPLNDTTRNMFDREAFRRMKKTAYFINVSRGGVVVDADLAWALENGEIQAAGLDVVSLEPIRPDNPLMRIQNSEKLLITPHVAWSSVEARTRLMSVIRDQIKDFLGKRV